MKYIEIVLLLMCISIATTLVDGFGLIPMGPNIDDTFEMAGSVQPLEFGSDFRINKTDSLNYEMLDLILTSKYSKTTLQTNIFQDTDFLTGTWIMIEIFGKGLFYVGSTLTAFGIAPQFHFFIIMPVYFMYLIALFQVLSGRNIEANK